MSTRGGREPVWSPTGRTIYFHTAAGEIFAVDVTPSPQIGLSAPRQIRKPPTLAPQRAAGPTSRAALIVVQGWTPGAEAQATHR